MKGFKSQYVTSYAMFSVDMHERKHIEYEKINQSIQESLKFLTGNFLSPLYLFFGIDILLCKHTAIRRDALVTRRA